MGHVIKDHSIAADPWRYVADDSPLAEGDIVVTLDRWLSESDKLALHRARIGVELRTNDDFRPLVPHLEHLDLVVIKIPAIGDGRCYSLARLLRVRHGYAGELRARGEFLIDQLQFMQRCGFNAYDPAGIGNRAAPLRALDTFSIFYQTGANHDVPVSALRSREPTAASVRMDRNFPKTPAAPRREISVPPLPGPGREPPAPLAVPLGEGQTTS